MKKAWDLTHITTEGADQAATTAHRYHPLSLPPDRSVSAPHMYQRTVPEQKHMATGIMNTSESDDDIHRGQTLHVGRAGPAQNQAKSGKPITNLLHAESTASQKPGEGNFEGQCCTI